MLPCLVWRCCSVEQRRATMHPLLLPAQGDQQEKKAENPMAKHLSH